MYRISRPASLAAPSGKWRNVLEKLRRFMPSCLRDPDTLDALAWVIPISLTILLGLILAAVGHGWILPILAVAWGYFLLIFN